MVAHSCFGTRADDIVKLFHLKMVGLKTHYAMIVNLNKYNLRFDELHMHSAWSDVGHGYACMGLAGVTEQQQCRKLYICRASTNRRHCCCYKQSAWGMTGLQGRETTHILQWYNIIILHLQQNYINFACISCTSIRVRVIHLSLLSDLCRQILISRDLSKTLLQ